jgi:hypothetical protein
MKKIITVSFIGLSLLSFGQEAEESLSLNEIKKEEKKNYFELGVNLGSPAILNARGAYTFNHHFVSVSGMYYSKYFNGVQLNYGYKLFENNNFGIGPTIAIGSTSSSSPTSSSSYDGEYVALGGVFSYKSFFMELGFGSSNDKTYNPKGPTIQRNEYVDFQIGVTFKL